MGNIEDKKGPLEGSALSVKEVLERGLHRLDGTLLQAFLTQGDPLLPLLAEHLHALGSEVSVCLVIHHKLLTCARSMQRLIRRIHRHQPDTDPRDPVNLSMPVHGHEEASNLAELARAYDDLQDQLANELSFLQEAYFGVDETGI